MVALEMLDHEARNKVNYTFDHVTLVLPTGNLVGRVEVTTTKFTHTPTEETARDSKSTRVRGRSLCNVTHIQRRRYLLHDSAVEIFFSNAKRPMFLTCGTSKERDALAKSLELSCITLKTSGYKVNKQA